MLKGWVTLKSELSQVRENRERVCIGRISESIKIVQIKLQGNQMVGESVEEEK